MHKTLTKEEVLRLLAESKLREADAASHLLQVGKLEVSSHVGASGDVLDTYQLRLEHIRSQPGAHARRLEQAMAELVSNLKSNRDLLGRWLAIKGDQEVYFIAWCLEQGQLLGCLAVVSQIDVSPDRWNELWSKNV